MSEEIKVCGFTWSTANEDGRVFIVRCELPPDHGGDLHVCGKHSCESPPSMPRPTKRTSSVKLVSPLRSMHPLPPQSPEHPAVDRPKAAAAPDVGVNLARDLMVEAEAVAAAGPGLLGAEARRLVASGKRSRERHVSEVDAWFEECVVPEAKLIIQRHGRDAACFIASALLIQLAKQLEEFEEDCPSVGAVSDKLSAIAEAVKGVDVDRRLVLDHLKRDHGR